MKEFSSTYFMQVLSWTVNYCISKCYIPNNARLTDHFKTLGITQAMADDIASAVSEQFGIAWSTTKCYGNESLLSFVSIPFQWQA